jgi:hypothetical protein
MSALDVREEPKNLGPRIRKYHHAITIVLSIEADDLGHHRHDTTIAQDTEEEADGPNFQDIHMTMKMMKSRWGHYALLPEFAER